MDPQALVGTLTQLDTAATKLTDLLATEAEIINERDVARFEALMPEKQQATLAFEQALMALDRLTQDQGIDLSPEGFKTFLSTQPSINATELEPIWLKAIQSLASCFEANERNGIMITAQQNVNQQLLNLFLGSPEKTATYDKSATLHASRHLGANKSA